MSITLTLIEIALKLGYSTLVGSSNIIWYLSKSIAGHYISSGSGDHCDNCDHKELLDAIHKLSDKLDKLLFCHPKLFIELFVFFNEVF